METRPEEFSIYISKNDAEDFINAEIIVFRDKTLHNMVYNKFVRETSKKMKSNLFKHVITINKFIDKYKQIDLTNNDKFDIKIDELLSVNKRTETGEASLIKILGYDSFEDIVYHRVMHGISLNGDQILSPCIVGTDIITFLSEYHKLNYKK